MSVDQEVPGVVQVQYAPATSELEIDALRRAIITQNLKLSQRLPAGWIGETATITGLVADERRYPLRELSA
jgi:hypothetical protein